MKKILFGIFVLLLSACSNEEIVESPQPEEGATAELTMSINVPEASSARSFGEAATITSLYLVVFDKQGYLAESAQATDFNTNGDETTFKVTLHQTTSKRIIHFIANYEIGDLAYGSESEIIGRMTVSGNQDAYWQRVELESGIANDEATTAKMKRVPLLRNFAKITASANLPNFTLEGFAVVNTLSKGTVAPYNTHGGGFANFISGEVCLSYDAIAAQGYEGFVPGDATINSELPAEDAFQATPYYMYERRHPGDNTTTYILLKGKYNKGASTYYKLDMVYKNAGDVLTYYNLLRNFQYAVTINSVTGNGYSTIEEAAAQPANNNFSGSVLTKSLLNISDGKERLIVSFTDTTLVNTDKIILKYKYIPDINSNNANNDAVDLTLVKQGEVIGTVRKLSGQDSQGYSSIEITPNEPGNLTLTQTVTLIGGSLSRDVTFTLRMEQIMEVSCSPTKVAANVGESVDVSIKIPNGLSETLFPLTFLIEAEALSLYPNASEDYMPVKVGASIVPSKNGASSFGFEKELTYDDYKNISVQNGNKEIVCHFLTNKEESGSTVYVHNKYFNLGEASFANNEPVIKNKTVNIKKANLRANNNYPGYNTSVSVYTDSNYSNEVASCSFEQKGHSNNKYYQLREDLKFEIPTTVQTLYFRFSSNNYYATASTLVSELESGTQKTLFFRYD
ncbi:hypothetical protein [Phocaeicola sartorii]|uniref:hypothetical protein n=1 Tax=Phocaeicola sartorii TaxID=671267 RepID=UPI00248AC9C9|nr:hypothetical protein [Phocaeicola sartorii]